VFLPGWEEGVFPNQRALEESGLKALEEERRLAYVGLTRARKRASISFAANRRIHGQWQSSIPSRFVEELPAERVEMLAEAGLMPGMAEPRDLRGWGKTEVLRAPRWSPRSGAPLIEGHAVPVRGQESRRVGGFKSGDRIFHQKFGYGTIQRVEDNKLAIAFDKAGDKMVMDSFVERA
jgi:DNA helicase-2/ATP-dependent DNA helicase PcrA